MEHTTILELITVAIAAAFILAALTRGIDRDSTKNLTRGELMYEETPEERASGRCHRHDIPLDPNGQICPDCLIEMRRGIGMKSVSEIMRGEIRPSWERSQL